MRAVRSSSLLPVNPAGVGFREWQTLGAHIGAHPAPSSPGYSPRSLTPIGKVSGLDLGTLNAPGLSLSNAFPLGGSFLEEDKGEREEIPEVPGGLCMPLCKQTLKVGPGTWGLQRCGPNIAGDSGLRHAVAGAPCKGHDRQPPHPIPAPPHQPRLPTHVPKPRSAPGLQALSVLKSLAVRGRPWRLMGAGGAGRVGVRSVSWAGGGGSLGAVNHPTPA